MGVELSSSSSSGDFTALRGGEVGGEGRQIRTASSSLEMSETYLSISTEVRGFSSAAVLWAQVVGELLRVRWMNALVGAEEVRVR